MGAAYYKHKHTGEILMTKNPYEIRFDLLTMAKDMLDRQYEQTSNMAWAAFEKAAEQNKDVYKEME